MTNTAATATVRYSHSLAAWVEAPAGYDVDTLTLEDAEQDGQVAIIDGRYGDLYDYDTAEGIRPATAAESRASGQASERDGGAGVILVDGRRVYVQ